MLQNVRVVAFTVSELFMENQQRGEGGKITPRPPPPRLGLRYDIGTSGQNKVIQMQMREYTGNQLIRNKKVSFIREKQIFHRGAATNIGLGGGARFKSGNQVQTKFKLSTKEV